MKISRREVLRWLGSGALLAAAPGLRAYGAPEDHDRWDRILVLVELAGGNDGLNTVIPYADPLYRSLRPDLAVERDKVLSLGEGLGLHPAMTRLHEAFREGELAVVRGVGYEHPNRSHFRSIEIWETGSDADETRLRGWLAELFARHAPPPRVVAEGVALGRRGLGPLQGSTRSVAVAQPERLLEIEPRRPAPVDPTNPALAHIMRVQARLDRTIEAFERRLPGTPPPENFPASPIGRALATAARLVRARIPVAVIKVSQSGYDTHQRQVGTHARLLGELSEGLGAFRRELKARGAWDRVLVMTYSEFGRRARQNGSRGTDHGTAAPHFFLGGAVRGGLYGRQPALDGLRDDDLVHHVDFRHLYATVARRWWGLPLSGSRLSGFAPLDCLEVS